jgi:hypothetical protein
VKLYGLGRRGVAIRPPSMSVIGGHDVDAPILLFSNREAVQKIIDGSGVGAWHVIEYEVVES